MKDYALQSWIVILLILVGCSRGPAAGPEEISPSSSPTLEPTAAAALRYPEEGVIYQWGARAEASSEFASPEWSAQQAAGTPDTPGCGDFQFAWASAASDEIATLEIAYSVPVQPLEIIIQQSFNPDQVVKVEVYDPETGGFYTVHQKNPLAVDRPCPYRLIIPVDGISFATDRVRITVDQSQLGLGWNEIDAVQLIGVRVGSAQQ